MSLWTPDGGALCGGRAKRGSSSKLSLRAEESEFLLLDVLRSVVQKGVQLAFLNRVRNCCNYFLRGRARHALKRGGIEGLPSKWKKERREKLSKRGNEMRKDREGFGFYLGPLQCLVQKVTFPPEPRRRLLEFSVLY